MLRILHTYISCELAKVTGLALAAFTLVMTVFAIIEPLREQGLAGDQVAALFVYTLPVMLSLTLPIGALFAATIVYGRFSQDNELLACRASGVSTMSVLKPALALALTVTAASLVLSNFVAPAMTERAGLTVTNVRGMAYNQLRTRKYVRADPGKGDECIVHADQVDVDNDVLYGVVAVYVGRGGKGAQVATAASTEVKFFEREDENYVAFDALHVSLGPLDSYDYGWEQRQPFPPIKIPNPAKEKPSWYKWGRLIRTIKNPQLDGRVSRELTDIRRTIAHDLFCGEAADTINGTSGERYLKLSGSGGLYVIQAGKAEIGKEGTVSLSAHKGVPVSVTSWTEGPGAVTSRNYAGLALPVGPTVSLCAAEMLVGTALPRIVTASAGMIKTRYDRLSTKSIVSIRLTEAVSTTSPAVGGQRRKEWSTEVELPERFVRSVDHISIDNIQQEAARLTSKPAILDSIQNLKNTVIRSLRGKLVAEMHGRIAYGVSCFLLVTLGAALGLIFRGGQIISAFATSTLPAAAIIVLVIMGKELARNPRISLVAGLTVIWAGIAALGLACVVVCLYLSRK